MSHAGRSIREESCGMSHAGRVMWDESCGKRQKVGRREETDGNESVNGKEIEERKMATREKGMICLTKGTTDGK